MRWRWRCRGERRSYRKGRGTLVRRSGHDLAATLFRTLVSRALVNVSSISKRVSRFALVGAAVLLGVPIELTAVAYVCSVLSEQTAIYLLLISPIAIGAGNYFLSKLLYREMAIRAEADRWLAWRSRRTAQQRDRACRLKQTLAWVPSLVVTILFFFMPESFGVFSHLWHGRTIALVGYEVEMPMTWIMFEPYVSEFRTSALAGAYECKGVMRSGVRRYLYASPIASAMSFRTPSGINPEHEQSWRAAPLSQETIRLNNDSIVCRLYAPRYREWESNGNLRDIECSASRGDLSASFFW